jgi:hypothetical protein
MLCWFGWLISHRDRRRGTWSAKFISVNESDSNGERALSDLAGFQFEIAFGYRMATEPYVH